MGSRLLTVGLEGRVSILPDSSSLNMLAKISVALAFFAVVHSQKKSGYVHDPTGDTGLPYEHDPTGDFGPYKLWKLRQEAIIATPTLQQPAQRKHAYKQQTYQQPQAYQQP